MAIADAFAMRIMYQSLGFTNHVATSLNDDEGLDFYLGLAELDHEAEVHQLCKTIGNPGGGQNGHTVSNRAERHLTNAAFLCKMSVRVQRPIAPATIRPGVLLTTAQVQLELEAKHKNDDALFTPLDNKRTKDHLFSTTAEKWVERLGCRRNAQKIPISYVMRENLAVTPHADDPANGYSTHDEEMIACMHIIEVGHNGHPRR